MSNKTHGSEWVEKNIMITFTEPNYLSLEVLLKWAKRNVTKYKRLQMPLFSQRFYIHTLTFSTAVLDFKYSWKDKDPNEDEHISFCSSLPLHKPVSPETQCVCLTTVLPKQIYTGYMN